MPPGMLSIKSVRFPTRDVDQVSIDYLPADDPTQTKTRLLSKANTGWKAEEINSSRELGSPVTVTVRQGLNDPPVLIATDNTTLKSRMVWDPNPQLKQFNLGEASAYRWKDKTGRDWVAGLYKPPDYQPGHRYPLVVQTHGFRENEFRPSGWYPTAFAARALAAHGFVVLQVMDCLARGTDEGPGQVLGYESAVEKLAAEGLIDSDTVGIVGFSRSCYYVMEALTTSALRFKAASITDGVNAGYLQYIMTVDFGTDGGRRDASALNGAAPYSDGLQRWIKRSPEFNIDKVTAPLQVVSLNDFLTLYMWEPYALLRDLKKPTDLIVINSNEHVLTNPGARLVSQGGTVDWFRFWLKQGTAKGKASRVKSQATLR